VTTVWAASRSGRGWLRPASVRNRNATSLKGGAYNNNYCWRIRFSGDKLCELLEFCDSHHAYEVLFGE
jgi:ketosteroid isomerase-like protein